MLFKFVTVSPPKLLQSLDICELCLCLQWVDSKIKSQKEDEEEVEEYKDQLYIFSKYKLGNFKDTATLSIV